jgi:hypothetical protein
MLGWSERWGGFELLMPIEGGCGDGLPVGENFPTHLQLTVKWDSSRRRFNLGVSPMAKQHGSIVYSTAWESVWVCFPADGAKRFSPKRLAALRDLVDDQLQRRDGESWTAVEECLAKNKLTLAGWTAAAA